MKTTLEFLKRFGFVLFVGLMFLILTCVVAFGQSSPPEGLQLIEREQPTRGIAALRKTVEEQPVAMNYYNLGCGLLQTGNLQEAASMFDKGLSVDSKNPLNHVGKGRILLRQGNLTAARVNLDKAIDLTRGKNAEVLAAVGEAWLDKQEFIATAKDYLQKSEALNPNATASLLLGDAFLAEANGGKAITNYEHAASLDVRNPTPHYKIGMVYVRSTNKDAALESLQKAISLDPGYTPAYKELAELYYTTKNGAEAVRMQEKYMELSEFRESGLVRMGYYLFMTRDFTRTNEVFEQAYRKGLLKETGLRYYALSLTENGDYSKGQRIFEEYFAKASAQQVEASDYASYGKVLLKLEQDSLAVVALQKSISIDSKQLSVRQLIAETLFRDKRYAEAVDAYTTLISQRSKPTSQDLYSLGRSLYFNNQFMKADTVFNQLIALQPTMTVGYLWAGRANAHLDPESEKGLAKPYYDKVVEIGQATPDKSKNDLREAFSYLGYYYLVKHDVPQSRANWEKVLALDPQDERAKEALKSIKP